VDENSSKKIRPAPELWKKLKPLVRQKRRAPTPAEKVLWQRLRDHRLAGSQFRRQHAIGRFIVDFYCAQARLVIEVDGPIHNGTPEEDAARQDYLERLELRVIRFTNDDVLDRTEDVLKRIGEAL
jgi:very-short-patch-repair endonuclease